MTNPDLFSYSPTGTQLRDEALERVAENAGEDFMTRALDLIERLPRGTTATGEEIRHRVAAAGIEPHHANAWGALISQAVRLKLMTPTGVWRAMKKPSSHARKTPVYMIGRHP